MEKYKIDYDKLLPLSSASHTIGMNGKKPNKDNPSQWAFSMAAFQFPRDSLVTKEDFKKALFEAMVYEAVSILIEEGHANLILNEQNEVVVKLND